MDSVTPSDPLLALVLYSGVTVLVLALVLMFSMALMRVIASWRHANEQRVMERWRPVFFSAIEDIPVDAPQLMRTEFESVLAFWIHLAESIRGEAHYRLGQMALAIGLDRVARRMLGARRLRARMMGIIALGHMKCHSDWLELDRLARDSNTMISLLAIRSLIQIDPKCGILILIDNLPLRQDWPVRNVAAILDKAAPEAVSTQLLRALRSAPATDLPRLLAVGAIIHADDFWLVLEPLLGMHQPMEVLVASLKVTYDRRSLTNARQLLHHADWQVRAQAAAAIGRIGEVDDEDKLVALLEDREWWVRYRAATALVQQRSMSQERLHMLCERIQDRFAADMLKQAWLEVSGGATR